MELHVWCDCDIDIDLHCHCTLPTAMAHTMGVERANALEAALECWLCVEDWMHVGTKHFFESIDRWKAAKAALDAHGGPRARGRWLRRR